jgi:hypothetical protein
MSSARVGRVCSMAARKSWVVARVGIRSKCSRERVLGRLAGGELDVRRSEELGRVDQSRVAAPAGDARLAVGEPTAIGTDRRPHAVTVRALRTRLPLVGDTLR